LPGFHFLVAAALAPGPSLLGPAATFAVPAEEEARPWEPLDLMSVRDRALRWASCSSPSR